MDTITKECKIRKSGSNEFKIILTQGLNRQIRRMCEYFNYKVISLERTRIMNIKLDLPVGKYRELTKEEKATQQQILEDEIANCDVLISTAAVPGKPAPRIIRSEAVKNMKPGAVIIDLAAETGGNCELTKAGETVSVGNVKIVGPINLAASLGKHASEMYARNLYNFLSFPGMILDEKITVSPDSIITSGCI